MTLLKPPQAPDKRWPRPKRNDRAGILHLIDLTYASNDWGRNERSANARLLGLEPKPLAERTTEELWIILDDLIRYKMILILDEGEKESDY
ncbi:MAG: hypothetical protein JSS81_07210 [Acidobacteria bacterium]|nr:hypothetical protein [Acidobacteriota bacterium]